VSHFTSSSQSASGRGGFNAQSLDTSSQAALQERTSLRKLYWRVLFWAQQS